MRRRGATDLGARLAGLRAAVEALDAVPEIELGAPQAREAARDVLTRAGRRRELSSEHTVVALAGATGSGKSSLLNAIAGFEAATAGARRPTTAYPLALVWTGPDGPDADAAVPLLEWLEVDRRHEIAASGPDAALSGLVLLDLPDIDSVDVDHRRRAERLAKTVDVLVWVLDPQKYADAVVHADFLRPMSRHADVTVVVLNQIDRLAEADRPAVMDDLRRRLVEDGLGGVTVVAASARTGDGVAQVREVIARFVEERRAGDARLAADVETAADALDEAYHADPAAELPAAASRRLLDALSAAAGVERVAEAVRVSFRQRARASTGWPLVRWLGRFRPDPLRRLHLNVAAPSSGGEVVVASSLPEASPVQRAQVHTALRTLGDAAAAGSGEPWRSYLRSGAVARADELPDQLDQAVVRTPLDGRTNPRWFGLVGAWQWLVFALFVAGVLWLGGYALLGYLRIPVTWVPQVGPVPADPPLPALPAIPWATVLLVGGAVLGIVVALLSALAARAGAARRARRTRAALRAAVAQTATTVVLHELDRRRDVVGTFATAVATARGKGAERPRTRV